MQPPWYARKKIATIDTHHIPAKKKIGTKRKCIELIPIVKLTLQP